MKLVSLGWELPPGFTNPINRILATVFRVAREPSNDIDQLLDRLEAERQSQKAA
jgi:hypothetical protein